MDWGLIARGLGARFLRILSFLPTLTKIGPVERIRDLVHA